MSTYGSRRIGASPPRVRRWRLTGALGALAVVSVISYAMLVVRDLRQIGASVDAIEAWSSQRETPAPSQSYMPDMQPGPSATVAVTPVQLPPLPPQARSATEIYDRGGDVADTKAVSPSPEAALHSLPDEAGVSEEHLPAPPASRPPIVGSDDRAFRRQLESLLANDQQALETALQLLDEPDQSKRAESLRILREAFELNR